jgi:hypothetical protein
MIRQFEEIVTGMHVYVVWNDDIDPNDTAPLWASVQYIGGNAPPTHHARAAGSEQVVIELSASPPERRHAGWNTGKTEARWHKRRG